MSKETATLGEILMSCWEDYKQRALPILAVFLISTTVLGGLVIALALCAVFGGALLAHIIADPIWAFIPITLVCILFLVITVLGLWCQTAMVAIVIDEDLGIIEAFQRGWEYLWPMTWVLTIFSGIIITGFVFGILPGILFFVWFSFSFYILLEEDKRGMDAILASMEYVRGNWWNTFGKLFVIWFLYTLSGIIPFIGPLVSILFYPFLMLFMVAVYRDLKSIKGEAELPASSGTRLTWWIITWIGLVAPIIALIAVMAAIIFGENGWMDATMQSLQNMQGVEI